MPSLSLNNHYRKLLCFVLVVSSFYIVNAQDQAPQPLTRTQNILLEGQEQQRLPLSPQATPVQPISSQQQFILPNFSSFAAIASLLTIVGVVSIWVFMRKKKRKFKDYFEKIDYAYANFKLETRRCEGELHRLRDLLENDLQHGKIEESTFGLLNGKIEDYLVKIRQQIVQEQFGDLPKNLLTSLKQILENGEVSEHEYESFIKILQNTAGIDAAQKDAVTQLVTDWKNK